MFKLRFNILRNVLCISHKKFEIAMWSSANIVQTIPVPVLCSKSTSLPLSLSNLRPSSLDPSQNVD
jgi:hypothetical protein